MMIVVCLISKNPMLVLKQSDSPVLSVPLLLTSFSHNIEDNHTKVEIQTVIIYKYKLTN